ncbi:MAG: hypothetical protein HY903_23240 [Deltaproteobacteria bacterium]|nr:hypothetical protein [Deltaproteobacteria bacterium]
MQAFWPRTTGRWARRSGLGVRFGRAEPLRLLGAVMTTIFVVEAGIMLLFSRLPEVSPFAAALMDASLLTVMVFPIVFLTVVRPMGEELRRRRAAEEGLRQAVTDLQAAAREIKTLRGMLPICARCKKIRNGGGRWETIEGYIERHSEASFTHGMCPTCVAEMYPFVADRGRGPSK